MNNHEAFEAYVKSEIGDIAVMDAGQHISPKINNYWLVWQASALENQKTVAKAELPGLKRLSPEEISTVAEACGLGGYEERYLFAREIRDKLGVPKS